MIQKLRRKFILTNMLLVSVVLVAVFAVLLGSTSQRLYGQSLGAMRMALQWTEEAPPPQFNFGDRPDGDRPEGGRGGKFDQFSLIPAFAVTVDAAGSVSAARSRGDTAVSDETAAQAVSAALATGRDEGTLSKLGLRFLVQRDTDATRLAFADTSWERENLGGLVGSSLLVGAGALLVFFLVSLFLAKLSLKPVKQAWEQQRQFVADASHELKTPLTVILANSGILLSHRADTVERQAKWVEYIQEEAQRMKGLVEDMLFLAKSDTHRASVAPTPVYISDLLTGCLLPFEPVAFEQGVALESEIAPDLIATGDEAQLRRLVLILLDNACKYAGERGRIDVALARNQDRLRLTVGNTGEPIAPEHLEHLFERFYRADSARSRDAGGYGLGLAIAKSIADSHRGKLSVTSTNQAGTVFTLLLPVAK